MKRRFVIYVKKKVIVLKDEDVMEQNIITLGISHTSQSTPAKTKKKEILQKNFQKENMNIIITVI